MAERALGTPLPDRDRDSEFAVKSDDAAALTNFMHNFSRQIMALLNDAAEVDWAAIRQTHSRPGDAPEKVPASWAVLHAIEHLREHVAHVGLTRQLWEARG